MSAGPPRVRPFLPRLVWFGLLGGAVGCSSGDTSSSSSSSASSTDSSSSAGGSPATTSAGGATSSASTGGAGGAAPDPKAICSTLELASRDFSAGPYGVHRGDLADDFTLDLIDGSTWSFKDRFSGCESYVFVPDDLAVSQGDSTSIWENPTDLANLLKKSAKNAHYFFVSQQTDETKAEAALQAQAARIETALSKLSAADAAQWKPRLHVVGKKAASLGGYISQILAGHGQIGFEIDRLQRIRGAGDLSDVARIDSALNTAGKWPFKSNLAYLANYPDYFNAQSDEQDRLDAESATVVDLWTGDTLAQLADKTVDLPSAADMAGFDTLEVEVTQQCPDPDKIEIGNCGAWDYLAQLYLNDDPTHQIELARFITSYHRETHWVVDVSELLPLLATGGSHAFEWSFAPSWNTQPTATKLSLRFSNQKKGMRPTQATFLYAGADFNAAYNTSRVPATVPIPSTAKKVELYAVVTGHGSGTNSCSEFCNHQHKFTVDTTDHEDQFPMAGTSNKCVPNDAKGMTPNQAGTWWYGRGGWCPGMQVDPWIVDVTKDVTLGADATVTYTGMFKNVDPPPDDSGNIVLSSYLIVWE